MIHTSNPKEIGLRIRNARRAIEMTQEELGEKVGVSRATINKYESGTVNFPRDRIELICKALNISAAYLLGWSEGSVAKKSPLFEPTEVAMRSTDKAKITPGSFISDIEVDDIARHFADMYDDTLNAAARPVPVANDPIKDELLRIYAGLSIKDKNKLLTFAYELEDNKCEQ